MPGTTRDSGAGAVRAFVALELPDGLRRGMAAVIERLRPVLRGVRWVSPAGLHLTLRFLGPSSSEALAGIGPVLRDAARACPPAQVRAAGLGMFPERGSPRVLWLHLELPEPVVQLQKACEAAAVVAGFPPETRPFRSHVSLGRWRDRAARPALPDADLGEARIEVLTLFRSELRPSGALHTPLASFRLGGED